MSLHELTSITLFRAPMPRKLEQQETLQTLNQWQSIFKNYYRRCSFYGYFLQPGITWTSGVNRGFNVSEPTGLKRTPEVLAADLDSLLECLGGFLPFDYVSEKLKSESTNVKSAFEIIYELYDAEIDTTHYLDYASMSMTSPNTGEKLTIGLLDSIAVHWLLAIDKRLIGIVKTEFAADLKTKRLCQMLGENSAA